MGFIVDIPTNGESKMKTHLSKRSIDSVFKIEYSVLACTGNISSHSSKIKARDFYQKYKDGDQNLCAHCVKEMEKRVNKIKKERGNK